MNINYGEDQYNFWIFLGILCDHESNEKKFYKIKHSEVPRKKIVACFLKDGHNFKLIRLDVYSETLPNALKSFYLRCDCFVFDNEIITIENLRIKDYTH